MGSSKKGQERFEALKRKLLTLGFVRPGSVVRRFVPCGNPSCRCAGKPPRLHGPYYEWSCKVAGKTRTIRLSQRQAHLCLQWVGIHKKLKRIVRLMERLSLKETDRALGAISRP